MASHDPRTRFPFGGVAQSFRRGVPTFVLAALLLPLSAVAGQIEIRLANDLGARNPRRDDLYTSESAVAFTSKSWSGVAGERMFTDRRRGSRADESYISVSKHLPSVSMWNLSISAGATRVGRGVLGQSMQNRVHDWIGSDELHLRYPDHNRTFAVLGLDASRDLAHPAHGIISASVGGSASPGFRSWLVADIRYEQPLGRSAAVTFSAGGRADVAQPSYLRRNVKAAGATASAELQYRALFVNWSQNDDGTGWRHFALGIRHSY